MILASFIAEAGLIAAAATDPGGDWISVLSRGSGPVLMAVIIVGAIRRWWVTGTEHREAVAQRDRLFELALKSTNTTERVVSLAEERATPAST